MKLRSIIGVICTEVSNTEQRQIICGIADQAQQFGVDIAVISNIYNSNTEEDENYLENEIYDLIMSPDLDGLILISESIVSNELKNTICTLLARRRDLPIIAIGTPVKELEALGLHYINTDEVSDFRDITDHLIDVHNFRDIDILTGCDNLETSNLRVQGYRRSLEAHAIPYDESKVFYGNFWINSGEQHAEKYIRGLIHMPQALICANDYMAYGVLDKFAQYGISVPQDIIVVGYEYVWERVYHYPLLTTYQRSRGELGKRAFEIIFEEMHGARPGYFKASRGKMIFGSSCPCKIDSDTYKSELTRLNSDKMYLDWSFSSTMDRQLARCTNVEELSEVMGKNSFHVRYVQDMFLCLYERWYDSEVSEQNGISCRSVLPWKDNSVSIIHKYDMGSIFSHSEKPSVYYFSPLIFGENSFGYTVLKYDQPDTYDIIYKNWIKSVSNALEFMRMKNDIRYFTAYSQLSEQYDKLTGIYNGAGFENALKYAIENTNGKDIIFIMMKLFMPDELLDTLDTQFSLITEISQCLKSLYPNKGEIFGRVDRNIFCFAVTGNFDNEFPEILKDKLRNQILFGTSIVSEWGVQSFSTAMKACRVSKFDHKSAVDELKEIIKQTENKYGSSQLVPDYQELLRCKNEIYLTPGKEHNVIKMSRRVGLSEGHFRKCYSDCFGISLHQDELLVRLGYAKYLLSMTSMTANNVADECGYDDAKYFLRTFRKNTGYTTTDYKKLFL